MRRYFTEPKEIDGIRVVQDERDVFEALKNGETVCRFEWGDSMDPILKNGEYAVLTPIKSPREVKRGDAVFCRMHGNYFMTHMVWEISDCCHDGKIWFKIGSTGTSIYGWTNEVLAIAHGMNCFENYNRHS